MRSCVLLLSLLVGTAYGVPQFPGDRSEDGPPTPVVDPPPIEDGPPDANFALTSRQYSEKDDHMQACKDAFGPSSVVADWTTDILPASAESVASLLDDLGVRETYNKKNYFVNRDREQMYGRSTRGYFFERHGKSGAPSNWLVHDTHAGLSLGSWLDITGPVVCKKPAAMCCMAFTASCMACAQGVSMEEYCSSHPDTAGCPKPAPDIEPKLCCKAWSARCMACMEGVSERRFCRHNPATPGCEEVRFHTKPALKLRPLIKMEWAFGILIFMAGLIWGFFERRRRRLTDHSQRVGGYITGLFDCLRKPAMWIPACLFTPVLAAFNRSEVDERECSVCDVCFAVIKPVAQYTTRQSLRGKYGLASEECSDLFSACCCTPCAVAQDAIELENRSSLDNNNALPAGLAAPGIPVFVMPTAQPVYAQVSEKETFVESEMKSHRVTHADNQV